MIDATNLKIAQMINMHLFSLKKSVEYVPEPKIWRDLKFVRYVDAWCNLLR